MGPPGVARAADAVAERLAVLGPLFECADPPDLVAFCPPGAAHVDGGRRALGRALVRGSEEPAAAAGFVVK